jgi:hypothetical protein
MSDKYMYIGIEGIDPEDILVDEEDEWDTAWDISNDIYDLLNEEYDLDVEGVSCIVNETLHEQLTETHNGTRY